MINSYQPSAEVKKIYMTKGEPIPVVYIPRKPHPNGLLNYLSATFIKHPRKINRILPFILIVKPHLKERDSAPQDAIRDFMLKFSFVLFF